MLLTTVRPTVESSRGSSSNACNEERSGVKSFEIMTSAPTPTWSASGVLKASQLAMHASKERRLAQRVKSFD